MRYKQNLLHIALAAAFVISSVAIASGQSVKRATWQTSVDDSRRGVVTLGVRDKWGTMGSFTATFVAKIGAKTFRGRMSSTGDEWAYIDFPSQFNGGTPPAGTYTITFYVNGVVIGRDRFRYRL